MKKLFCLIIFLITSITFSQKNQYAKTLHISVLEKSNVPLSNKVHKYTYTVTNNSSNNIKYLINVTPIDCKRKSSGMSVRILDTSLKKMTVISPHESKLFEIELRRNHLTKLDTWSCLKINAVDRDNNPVSNIITVSQFIPDTKNFQ